MIRKYIVFFLALALVSCEEEIADPCSSKFDQTAMFTNVADNLIVPAYQDLQVRTNTLATASTAFSNDISIANLQSLRAAWASAYRSWQTAALYNFGPAEAELLRESLNNYPVDTDAINTNIEAGTWDLDAVDTYDKGFPALDYLLYGTGENEAAIVDYFQNSSAAIAYVVDITVQIKTKVDATMQAWSDGYRETFIENTGTADGSALSQIVNGINEHYERLKRDKIGIPSGVVALGIPRPQSVEARFSGISLELAVIALVASQKLFKGKDDIGLEAYLNEVNAKKGDELLSRVISNQYILALGELNKITGTLSEAVEAQNEQVIEAYRAVTTQVVHLKTDMPSVLCVAITYVDNPSDSD